MKINFKSPVFLYTLKCLLGLSIGYLLFIKFPRYPFYWTLVSILLVMAPDHHDSSKLALDRVKANMIGSTIGLLLFMVNGSELLMMGIGVITTISICYLLKILTIGKSALAAFLIVILHERHGNTWQVAVERLGCVALGCAIALIISAIFGYVAKK
ncbi:MAG TPA: FUSC family protein [Bacteroidia bacterium]|nr:FUSC family protein [Bacteroidia bacterium]